MRKIILNLAMSLDGYISDLDGGFDWIVGHGDKNDTDEVYDFDAFLQGIDTVVMGSVAYEDCILTGLTTFDNKDILVATSRDFEKRDQVTFVKSDICQKVLDLKKQEGKNIWLFGGAGLTDDFIRNNIVDEYVVAIIPTILGNGRRLFKGDYPKIDLYLKETQISEGIPILTYIKR